MALQRHQQLPEGVLCARDAAILVSSDHLLLCIMHVFLMITYCQLTSALNKKSGKC